MLIDIIFDSDINHGYPKYIYSMYEETCIIIYNIIFSRLHLLIRLLTSEFVDENVYLDFLKLIFKLSLYIIHTYVCICVCVCVCVQFLVPHLFIYLYSIPLNSA